LAVFSAVSARPLRAPCVEMKYCRTLEALAEVGGDGRLDDRAVGFGHETPHPGQLPDLSSGTPRPRVGHHVDGVEGLLLDHLALFGDDLLLGELLHHRLGHQIGRPAPDVDHLVVAFGRRHQTRGVLLGDLLDLFLGLADDLLFLRRDEQVLDGDGDAAAGGEPITGRHQLVGEDHRGFEPAVAVGVVDELGDGLLLERLVDELERQAGRQDLGEDRPAHGGLAPRDAFDGLAVGPEVVLLDAHGDARMQRYLPHL